MVVAWFGVREAARHGPSVGPDRTDSPATMCGQPVNESVRTRSMTYCRICIGKPVSGVFIRLPMSLNSGSASSVILEARPRVCCPARCGIVVHVVMS